MHIFINTLNCCQVVIILIIKIYNSDLMLQMYVKNFIFFFQVLQTAQKEMLNYNNTGISVMGEECFKEQLTMHVFN